MAQNDVQVTIRVDKNVKDSADKLFNQLGLNMSTALNIFLRKAVSENAIPFPVSAKPASFVGEYSESDITAAFQSAVQNETARKKQNGNPVAKYDSEAKQAYLEYPDGRREYTGELVHA
jgi:addiction module RelB/DinJ family antitoxin